MGFHSKVWLTAESNRPRGAQEGLEPRLSGAGAVGGIRALGG